MKRWIVVTVALVVAVVAVVVTVRTAFGGTSASGSVQPVSTTALNFATTGYISELDVRPGDHVTAGEMLAKIDPGVAQAQLTADQAVLAADLVQMHQYAGPVTPQQSAQLQAQVDVASAQQSSAQNRLVAAESALSGALSARSSLLASAGATISQAKRSVSQAQSQVNADAVECATVASLPPSPTPSQVALADFCARISQQLATNETALAVAQQNYSQADASSAQAVTSAQTSVTDVQQSVSVTTSQLSLARSGQAVGLVPGTGAQVANASATVSKDKAVVAADQLALSRTVITAPTDGIVGSIGGIVGELAAPDGVHTYAASTTSVAPSGGIQLFPSAPQANAQSTAAFSPMVELFSPVNEVVAQVAEGDVAKFTNAHPVKVTFPAVSGTVVDGIVSYVEPKAVNQSGQVFYLVHIRLLSDGGGQVHAGMTADTSF